MPDVPVAAVGAYVALTPDPGPSFTNRMAALYFHEPTLIVAHNFLHPPLVIIILASAALIAGSRHDVSRLLALTLALGLHSTIDILTHHDDGPLLLWPFGWARWKASSSA